MELIRPGKELYGAVLMRDFETVQTYLNGKYDLNQRQPGFTKNGCTPLILAVQCGDLDMVRILIEGGCDVDTPGDVMKETALIVAAQTNELEIAEYLICRGADLDSQDISKRTALVAASQAGYQDMVALLLRNGCDVSLKTAFEMLPFSIRQFVNIIDSSSELYTVKEQFSHNDAFLKACWSGHVGIAKMLIDHGCNVDTTTLSGYTGLHIAAMMGNNELTELLLDADLDLHAVDHSGDTPLHLALKEMFKEHNQNVINKLNTQVEVILQLILQSDLQKEGGDNLRPLYILLCSTFPENCDPIISERCRLQVLKAFLQSSRQLQIPDLPKMAAMSAQVKKHHPDLHSWLTTFIKTPRSLQHQARIALRGHLTEENVLHMLLPQNIVNDIIDR